MNLIKAYGDLIKKSMSSPKHALDLFKLGLNFEKFRLSILPDKYLPKSLQYLNKICINYVLYPLTHPNSLALVNLFAPSEILHAMDIYPLFVEAFSSFLSGFMIEDYFIDYASNFGLSETLCSYHKAFLGAAQSKLIPKPRFAIASSMICDANIRTFSHISELYNIPLYIIDIPYEYTKEAEEYVSTQLKEMVALIENITNKKLDLDKLKHVIKLENQSISYNKKFLHSLKDKYFPNTLTMEMYKIFLSHVGLGTEETLKFYKMQLDDIQSYPKSQGKRFLWVHLLPFYHETLRNYFNINENYQILTCDLNFDYTEELDYEHPFNALAKKMLLNQYNGGFEIKANNIANMCKELNADAVINFCHWGCKQSSGGTMLLKEILSQNHIPFLSLDGDCVDRRNTENGQIQTRFQAFLEVIEADSRKEVI
ncbi:2-hydroxyacyl-CoA dehydratase subunit D [Clostridium sp.]|jgi:benzoyl-CoA reductase/2-hydroxyglutaryl-CoA dehydratase subunit BcrC/BadD/HgdB|uniref:2-hydroxyacyl-CoA dehydratase subunit D n=1 Tax=Clostridium sp. TaxID=1506 RepID=UPI0039F63C55